MATVSFLFPTVRSKKVEPLSSTVGVAVADAQIVQSRYAHANSHKAGAYDELRLDQLASGVAAAGTFLRADGAGGAQFEYVPSSNLSFSIALGGKRIKYRVPTRVVSFSFPQHSSLSQFSARVTVKEGSNASSPVWHWRLFDRATQTELVASTGANAQTFTASLQSGAYEQIELHVWLDATSSPNDYIVVESLLINSP